MKKVLIFGSTGSVGKSALEVLGGDRKQFRVLGLCANSNTEILRQQIKEFKPLYVCVKDEAAAKKISKTLGKGIKLFTGDKGLEEFAQISSDISFMAISGISCLKPLLINIRYARRIALANKESLVTAGFLIFSAAEKFNTEILPVDSEINALFQLLAKRKAKGRGDDLRKVYLTASGGALLDYNKKDLNKVGVKEVLAHPTWKMGRRITVDCATLVNKAFEAIETHYFFDLSYEKIDIVLHKESIAHALVECKDNTLFACLYPPDMKMPISFALYHPKRAESSCEVNFKKGFSFSFSQINYSKYPLLSLVLKAAKRGDNSLVVLNACDEVAIDYFLKGKINFTDIDKAMKKLFKVYPQHKIKTIDDVFHWDDWARAKTKEYLDKL